jgi:phosphohistidine phosphatase SixA
MMAAGRITMRALLFGLLFLIATPVAAQEHPVFATKITPPQGPMLVDMLKGGGFVIFFRHAATPDFMEPAPIDLTSCARQRNLNARGRAQAFALGEAFRELEIPFHKVLASPFCRTMDTARIAFGRAEPADELQGFGGNDKMRGHFLAVPPSGTNLVLVGHGSAGGIAGEEFLREAEALIVKPSGDGKFELIARVQAEQWAQMLPRNRLPPPLPPAKP